MAYRVDHDSSANNGVISSELDLCIYDIQHSIAVSVRHHISKIAYVANSRIGASMIEFKRIVLRFMYNNCTTQIYIYIYIIFETSKKSPDFLAYMWAG